MKFICHTHVPDKGGQMRVRGGQVLLSKTSKRCLICGEPTEYIDIASEARFCSDECMDEFYRRLVENEEARAVEDD